MQKKFSCMNKEECFYFGRVIKTHGIKGEISIRIDADDPKAYASLVYILIEINKKLVPFFIQSLKNNGNKAYVALEDVKTIEQAMELTNKEIFLPLTLLPKLSGTKFYFHEVPGFSMVDEAMGEIGQIETVLEYPNQNVFQVFKDKKEILIPIRDEIIKKVDRKKKIIYILAPEGLIDLYLNS